MTTKSQKRLIKDICDIVKSPLTDQGIFYTHDEENMLNGYAMIIGPEDTVYEHGFYFFKFTFSNQYPFVPPVVTFCTSDGRTRFNPNLYVNGKVCLSILNTWKGEQWTSCQTIRSILLTIVSILNNEPLLNEPGIKKSHVDFKNYNDIIRYKNYNIALLGMLDQKHLPSLFINFFPFMKRYFLDHFDDIIKRINELCSHDSNNKVLSIKTYCYMYDIKINYKRILDSIVNVYGIIKSQDITKDVSN